MKEARYFYVPKAGELDELPQEEAQHAMVRAFSLGRRSLLLRESIATTASSRAFRKRRDGKDICISLWLLRR